MIYEAEFLMKSLDLKCLWRSKP